MLLHMKLVDTRSHKLLVFWFLLKIKHLKKLLLKVYLFHVIDLETYSLALSFLNIRHIRN